jgi:HEAT repeat protein
MEVALKPRAWRHKAQSKRAISSTIIAVERVDFAAKHGSVRVRPSGRRRQWAKLVSPWLAALAAVIPCKMLSQTSGDIPSLIQKLHDHAEEVRESAADALAKTSPPAVPAMINVLNDRDPSGNLRGYAAYILGKIGPGAQVAVPALIHALLQDPQPDVRSLVARSLAEIGPGAQAALPALIRALRGEAPRSSDCRRPLCFVGFRWHRPRLRLGLRAVALS